MHAVDAIGYGERKRDGGAIVSLDPLFRDEPLQLKKSVHEETNATEILCLMRHQQVVFAFEPGIVFRINQNTDEWNWNDRGQAFTGERCGCGILSGGWC